MSITNQNFLRLFRGTRGQSSLRELLQPLVEGVLNDKNLSINTNPLEVYKAWINQMESETGTARYEFIPLLMIEFNSQGPAPKVKGMQLGRVALQKKNLPR